MQENTEMDLLRQDPLSNLQEEEWKRFFSKDIYVLAENAAYEDNNIRVRFSVKNAEDFTMIRKITDLSQLNMAKDLLLDIFVESKGSEVELKTIVYENVPLATIPLLTSSGFYINGTPYGVLSESSLAPGWYINRLSASKLQAYHRSKYGANFSIVYATSSSGIGKFSVKMNTRNRGAQEVIDIWTFMKALSSTETFSDILKRLNKLNIFIDDYVRVQQLYTHNAPNGSTYSEPDVETCAAKVLKSQHKYMSTDMSCVTELQNMLFTENRLNMEPQRRTRFERMCGFNAAVGLQLAKDAKIGPNKYLKRGTAITPEDITHLTEEGTDHIYVEHEGRSFKLFKGSIEDAPTFMEFVSVLYYFGLYISGIGSETSSDDFENKTIKTVSTMIGSFLDKQLSELTKRMVDNYTSIATNSLSKIFTSADPANRQTKSLSEALFNDHSFNMKDETNSVAAFQQGSKLTSIAKGLGKQARRVQPSHFNRVCSFTTPEGKQVGITLSMTLGSQVENGYIVYPVFKIVNGVRVKNAEVTKLNSTMEANKIIAPFTANLDEQGDPEEIVANCRLNGEIISAKRKDINFQDINSLQGISPILLFVPSFNRDAGKRLTMAANALTQARQPVKRQRAYCSTGIEAVIKANYLTARDIIISSFRELGIPEEELTPDTVITLIEINDSFTDAQSRTASYGTELVFNSNIPTLDRFTYIIDRLQPATNDSIKHQRVLYSTTSEYKIDDVVIISNDTDDRNYDLSSKTLKFGKQEVSTEQLNNCSLAIGENVNVLFTSYEGFGYEDSVCAKQSFVEKYGLASAGIFRIKEEAVCEYNADNVATREEHFSQRPNNISTSNGQYSMLEADGLARIGSKVKANQVVVGKTSTQLSTKHMSGSKVVDRSNKLPVGKQGTVINKFILGGVSTKFKKTQIANVILGDIQKLGHGDKVGGLHGNKGVIGKIIADKDMPYCEYGTPDIMLNPLGVISRTNLGQLIEGHLGAVGRTKEEIQFLEPFSEMTISEMIHTADSCDVREVEVFDGRTGRRYERKAFMANMYFLRSAHTSTSKFNSCGLTAVKRNSVTRQPIKCRGGGQRIGELLANSFRGHNATKVLEDFFSVQSDDATACEKLVQNIASGVPEEPITGNSNNDELFLAFFRTLGLNIIKSGSTNKFFPVKDADIDTLSLHKITLADLNSISRQATSDIFLRDTSFLNKIGPTTSMEVKMRQAYTSLELPAPVIMPLLCYGDKFLNMFFVSFNGKVKPMSTFTFKRILLGNYILVNRNFDTVPMILPRHVAMEEGLMTTDSLTGAEALMYIFREYNLNISVGLLETMLETEGVDLKTRHFKGDKQQFEGIRVDISETDTDEDNSGDKKDMLSISISEVLDDIDENINGVSDDGATDSDTDETSDVFDELGNTNESSDAAEQQDEETDSVGDQDSVDDQDSDAEILDIEDMGVSQVSDDLLDRIKLSSNASTISTEALTAVAEKTQIKTTQKMLTLRGDIIGFIETQDINDYFVSSILIPPIAYRPDFEGGLASPIDKQLLSLIGKLKSWYTNKSDYNFTSIYRELFWMISRNPKAKEGSKNIFDMILAHDNKNSKVRDTLFAKRIIGTGRSVIIVNPELKLGQCKIPLNIAIDIFECFLQTGTAKGFAQLAQLMKKNAPEYQTRSFNMSVFKSLASDNLQEFSKLLKLENLNYQDLVDKMKSCKSELIYVVNELLKVYPVILNREPSLKKFNAMGFDSSVGITDAIELHPLACSPYNADFDGDQMAIFVPFTPEAIKEAREKMNQRDNLFDPKDGKLVVDLNQDMILGMYWMTMFESNQKNNDSKSLAKVYNITSKQVAMTVYQQINNDMDSGVIQPKEVIRFKNEDGIWCLTYAQDAEFFIKSDRFSEDYDAFLGTANPVTSKHLTEVKSYESAVSASSTKLGDEFLGYKDRVLLDLWDDFDNSIVMPQQTIVLDLGGKKYRSTLGRILFNSLLPDGEGFTNQQDTSLRPKVSEEELSKFPINYYKLKFDSLLTKKNILPILDYLKSHFIKEANNNMVGETAEFSGVENIEISSLQASNRKFCETLDRLKDVGFLMADVSGISVSLYDFYRLELTRENIAVQKVLLDSIKDLRKLSKEEVIAKASELLAPMDNMLSRITRMKDAVCEETALQIVELSDIAVLMNGQHNTPYSIALYVASNGNGSGSSGSGSSDKTKKAQYVTLAQATIMLALKTDSLSFPLDSSGVIEQIKEDQGSTVARKLSSFIEVVTDILSKNMLSYKTFIANSVDSLTEQTGVNLMRHKIDVINRKFKEGRITESNKRDKILSVSDDYKKLVLADIESTLQTSRNSNLFIMVDSGARGNTTQLMETCGMIGVVPDSTGRPIPTLIEGNLLNGLNPTELSTVAYHARTIIVNTQMDIPASGSMNRKLSYSTEFIKIRDEELPDQIFCGTDSVKMPLKWIPILPTHIKKIYIGDRDVDSSTTADETNVFSEDDLESAEECATSDSQLARSKWDRFCQKYYSINTHFGLTEASLAFIRDTAEQLGESEIGIYTNDKSVSKIEIDKLKPGMDLYVGDEQSALVAAIRNEFISSVAITSSVKDLLAEEFVTKVVYMGAGHAVKEETIKYKLDPDSVLTVYFRSIDKKSLPDDCRMIADKCCIDKFDIENRKHLVASIIGQEFLDELENSEFYMTELPIYTMINCKNEKGICRKCYGMKYDTFMMPEAGELIGYQGVQAVCSTLSQMILDTHKSAEGGLAQKDIAELDQVITSEMTLNTAILADISSIMEEVRKGTQGSEDPNLKMQALNRALSQNALGIIMRDKHALVNALSGNSDDVSSEDLTEIISEKTILDLAEASLPTVTHIKLSGTSPEMITSVSTLIDNARLSLCVHSARDAMYKAMKVDLESGESIDTDMIFHKLSGKIAIKLASLLEDSAADSEQMIDDLSEEVLTELALHLDEFKGCDTVENLEEKYIDGTFRRVFKSVQELTNGMINALNHELIEAQDLRQKLSAKTALQGLIEMHSLGNESSEVTAKAGHTKNEQESEKFITDYVNNRTSLDDQMLYMKAHVWFQLIDMMEGKDVLSRNIELFSIALNKCGVALEDSIVGDSVISTGCIYPIEKLTEAGIKFVPKKLTAVDALGYNGQIYSDAFLGNTRQTIIKHLVRGTNDIGSPIGQTITGVSKEIVVKDYDFETVSNTRVRELSEKAFQMADEETDLFDSWGKGELLFNMSGAEDIGFTIGQETSVFKDSSIDEFRKFDIEKDLSSDEDLTNAFGGFKSFEVPNEAKAEVKVAVVGRKEEPTVELEADANVNAIEDIDTTDVFSNINFDKENVILSGKDANHEEKAYEPSTKDENWEDASYVNEDQVSEEENPEENILTAEQEVITEHEGDTTGSPDAQDEDLTGLFSDSETSEDLTGLFSDSENNESLPTNALSEDSEEDDEYATKTTEF